jgi:energy-coupling factor transporter transmembrane protein EcfT
MLINNILYTIIVVILTIVVLVGVTWLIHKKLKNSQGFVIGFFLAGVVFVGCMFGIGRLYIVDEENEVETYRVFGTFSYEFADGNTITRSYDPDSVMIINNSFNTLALEEIIYSVNGKNTGSSTVYPIASWSCRSFSLPGNRVYYFFDEEIDKSISEPGHEPVSRFWLHSE